jgi:hypothetical protein
MPISQQPGMYGVAEEAEGVRQVWKCGSVEVWKLN